jgi:hypothetical protein
MHFYMFFIALPKKTEKMSTGTMHPIMTRVSCHEMMNTKMKATMMKMKERTNIDTFVERPSCTTAMSAPIRLTTRYY